MGVEHTNRINRRIPCCCSVLNMCRVLFIRDLCAIKARFCHQIGSWNCVLLVLGNDMMAASEIAFALT